MLSKCMHDEYCFINGLGEFSVSYDIAFERHLSRYHRLKKLYSQHIESSQELMFALIRIEPFWVQPKAICATERVYEDCIKKATAND